MKRRVISGLLVLLLAMMVSDAYARFTVKPTVSIREEYNDNIFLTERDKEDDYITTVSPFIALQYSPHSKLDVILNYGFNFRFYGNNNEFNDTSLRDTQSIQLNVDAKPFNRVFIVASDTYDRIAIDQRIRTSENNAFLNKTDRNIFMISPYVVLPIIPSASLTVGYEYTNTWHKEIEATDSDSHSLFGSLDKKFNSKLTGFLSYRFTKHEADRSDLVTGVDSYDKQDGTVGITYNLNSKVDMSFEIGTSSLNAETLDNSDSVIWKFSGAYNRSTEGALSAIVTYDRTFLDSTINGASKSDSVDLIVKHGRIYKITVNPYYTLDKFVNVDREDRVLGIKMNLSKDLNQKIAASISGAYDNQKNLPTEENITQFSTGPSFDVKVNKQFTASVGYSFASRDSNLDDDDYINNILWVQGRYDF